MNICFVLDEVICLWVDVNTNCEGHPVAFEPIASFFGLWHEHRRGNHRGLHEFYFNSNYLLLLNVFDNRHARTREGDVRTYQYLLPPEVNPLKSTKQFDKSLIRDLKRKALPGNVNVVKATELGQSCNEVCFVNLCIHFFRFCMLFVSRKLLQYHKSFLLTFINVQFNHFTLPVGLSSRQQAVLPATATSDQLLLCLTRTLSLHFVSQFHGHRTARLRESPSRATIRARRVFGQHGRGQQHV